MGRRERFLKLDAYVEFPVEAERLVRCLAGIADSLNLVMSFGRDPIRRIDDDSNELRRPIA